MNTSKEPTTGPLLNPPPTTDLVWQGHMSEDGGFTSGPKPCATLSANASGLHLHGTRGDFRLARTAIVKLGRGKLYPWFFSAVQIHHAVPGYSRELQFKPMGTSVSEVFARLGKLGYPLK